MMGASVYKPDDDDGIAEPIDWKMRALVAESRVVQVEAQLAACGAYEAGVRAARRGAPMSDNPYSSTPVCGWSLRLSWDAGYGSIIEAPDDGLASCIAAIHARQRVAHKPKATRRPVLIARFRSASSPRQPQPEKTNG